MPANDHLEWIEIREFGGLYTQANKFLMPGNAAQIMRNCSPRPGGGLRAFFRRQMLTGSTTPTSTGLDPNDLIIGAFAHPSGGINPISERYLMTWRTTDRIPRLMYSTGAGWTPLKAFAATSAAPTLKQSFFETYLSGSTRKVVFNLNVGSPATASEGDGIWIVTGGGAPSKMNVQAATNPGGPITVFQGRIVVTDGTRIRFTNGQTETFLPDNDINVEPSGLRPNTVFMAPYEPSDLLIGKEAGPMILVQGDLADPTVRAMDETVNIVATQSPGQTPAGLVFTAHRAGVYATSSGSTPRKLSDPLSPNNFTLPQVFGTYTPSWMGNTLYMEGFIFTPSAIFDVDSGAWFTSNAEPGNLNAPLYVYDRGS